MLLKMSRQPAHRRVGIQPSQLSAIRARLEQERCFRIEQLVMLVGELAAVDGGQARREVNREVRSAAQHILIEIEDAIARLDDGTYGTCQRCMQAVEGERLEAVPSTRLCWGCHSGTGSTDRALQHSIASGEGTG